MTDLDLDTLHLAAGAHDSPDDGMCVMEAVSFYASEDFSDAPACVSPVIQAFLVAWNDDLDDDDRQTLKQHIPHVVGTNAGPVVDERLSWMALDWLVRVHAPAWLRLAGLVEQADILAGMAEVTAATCPSILPALRAIRSDAAAARAAAEVAAWDAVRDAAGAAAGAAARNAVRAAGGAAAWDAAWDAAGAAAEVAAWAAGGAAAWDAAGAAAGDAARAAARAAAWYAARAAAWYAAWYAAWAAAGAAAWYAAFAAGGAAGGAAARAAAFAAARDTVEALQESAHDLVRRMIAVAKAEASS